MRIIIIGMPGVGKTTTGKELAKLLDINFIDSDNYIERKYKMSISDIFNLVGEKGFRILEENALIEVLKKDDFILATGGGLPCFSDNMELINASGISIHLFVNPEILHNRIHLSKKNRPLLQGLSEQELTEQIQETYNVRRVFYEKAMYTINTEQEYVADKIKEIVSNLS